VNVAVPSFVVINLCAAAPCRHCCRSESHCNLLIQLPKLRMSSPPPLESQEGSGSDFMTQWRGPEGQFRRVSIFSVKKNLVVSP